MSLIFDAQELAKRAERLVDQAKAQQLAFFTLVDGLVAISQDHRVAGRYDLSDQLRALLKSAGVEITQGTKGMTLGEVRKKYPMNQPPIGDRWKWQPPS